VNCCSGSMYHGVYAAGAGACTHLDSMYPVVSLFDRWWLVAGAS
jgi:hypothetical protein